jgi:putative endonuclease
LGAKYTFSRRPVKLVFSKEFKDCSAALKEEARIKKLTRAEKLSFLDTSANQA